MNRKKLISRSAALLLALSSCSHAPSAPSEERIKQLETALAQARHDRDEAEADLQQCFDLVKEGVVLSK